MIIYIDFDKTICPNGCCSNPPTKDCLDVINILIEKGCQIIIYSVRSNPNEVENMNSHNDMVSYLKKYRIPYDKIETTKPFFHYIIDDRSLGVPKDIKGNVDWFRIKNMI